MKIVKRISLDSLLLALALVLSLAESLYMPSLFIPGVKLGLANIVILFSIYILKFYDSFAITILRVFIVSLLSGNIFQMGFFMSLLGALLSLLSMFILKLIFKEKLSVIFISIIGSLMHISGQIIIALIYLENLAILYYFPIIAIISILTGFVIGIAVRKIKSNQNFMSYINEKIL